MSSFDMLGNKEFEEQVLVIKNSHPIAWNALKLSDYCSKIPYGNKKKAIKYIKEEIAKYISGPLLDKFTNLDDIDLQESTMVANMLSMSSNISILNYILASIFKENFYYNEMIEMIEKDIDKREELINSFENKVERLLQLTGELDNILSVQCPKYKSQALVIGKFIDEEFEEFSYLSEDVGSYLRKIKSNIHSGIKYYTQYYESIRYETIKRYSFCKELLPIDKIIDKYYTDKKQQLINNMTKKLKKINTIHIRFQYSLTNFLLQ
jgi:Mg2+ and Co2+ transporter CorA